jgi:hypothetical protein
MSTFYDVRGKIIDANLVGRRVFRPEQVEKATFPYAEVDEGEAQTSPDVRGYETRDIDINVYLRRSDNADLPRQVANLFRKLNIGGTFYRVENVNTEHDEGIFKTTIEVVARVPIT